MKNKSFWVVFFTYCILFFVDIITTVMNPHHQLLEANPIYGMTGSFWPIIILNGIIAYTIYWLYTRKPSGPTMRFMVMNIMVVVIMLRIFVIKNAINYLTHPITVETAQQIGTAANKAATTQVIGVLTYLPLFLTLITYALWKIDHEVQRK